MKKIQKNNAKLTDWILKECSMRLAIICCVVLFVIACGEKNQTNKQPPSPTIALEKTKPLNQSNAELLAAFNNDVTVCVSAMLTFEKDRAFLSEFMDAFKREAKPLEDFLRQASFSKSGDIQYILENTKYFVIDVTFHPTAFAIAWVKNEPVYCAVSMQRLEEIEARGESPEAWKIRVFFLDRWLKDLMSPSNEADFFPEQYEGFNKFVTAASNLYSLNQGSQLQAWLKTAIEHFELQRNDLEDGAGGQTLAEQNKILDNEVTILKALLQQSLSRSDTSGQSQVASSSVGGR